MRNEDFKKLKTNKKSIRWVNFIYIKALSPLLSHETAGPSTFIGFPHRTHDQNQSIRWNQKFPKLKLGNSSLSLLNNFLFLTVFTWFQVWQYYWIYYNKTEKNKKQKKKINKNKIKKSKNKTRKWLQNRH